MSVVQFRRKEPVERCLEGQAHCIGCKHAWTAVAPVGTWQLECPSCASMKGVWTNPVGAMDGDEGFACNCGCEALTAYTRHGKFWLRCMSCGTDQTEAVFG